MPVYAENVMPGESHQPATHSRRIQNLYQDILEEFRNSTKTFKKNSETPPQFKKENSENHHKLQEKTEETAPNTQTIPRRGIAEAQYQKKIDYQDSCRPKVEEIFTIIHSISTWA